MCYSVSFIPYLRYCEMKLSETNFNKKTKPKNKTKKKPNIWGNNKGKLLLNKINYYS